MSVATSSRPGVDERRALFDAFFEFVYNYPYNTDIGKRMPRSERGRLNRAVAEAADAGITPADIRRRGSTYRVVWPDVTRSAQALLANWARFAPVKPVEVSRPARGSCVRHVWAMLPEGAVCAVCQVSRAELRGGNQ